MNGLLTLGGGDSSGLAAPLFRAALLGDFASPEFARVSRLVRTDAEVAPFDMPARLVESETAEPELELLLVAQARPGEWGGAWIHRLRRRAPLVRIVAVLGTWCAGETRTGRPLAADVRVFWHEFPIWWARQMRALRAGAAADWSYPDKLRGAALSAAPDRRDAYPTRGELAIVAAEGRESAEALGLALRVGGWSSVWVRPPRQLPDVFGASAIVYDGSRLDEQDLRAIEWLHGRYGPLPVVALTDLPTEDDVAAAEALAGTLLLGKPFLVEDLLWALDRGAAGVAVHCQHAGE